MHLLKDVEWGNMEIFFFHILCSSFRYPKNKPAEIRDSTNRLIDIFVLLKEY